MAAFTSRLDSQNTALNN